MGNLDDKSPSLDTLDFSIALGAALALLTARFIPLIQYIPATFAVILCLQDKARGSWKVGLNRMIITAVGGAVGIAVILLDGWIGNEWAFYFLAFGGVILTLLGCKLFKLPYILARIGAVTFVLVVTVMEGNDRLAYAGLRLLGTFYGVILSLVISFAGQLFPKGKVRSRA